jgi:hypothetical protein
VSRNSNRIWYFDRFDRVHARQQLAGHDARQRDDAGGRHLVDDAGSSRGAIDERDQFRQRLRECRRAQGQLRLDARHGP